MDERSEGNGRLIAIVVIVLGIAGVWYFLSHTGTREAVDETVEAFVPGPERIERGMNSIEESRRLTDLINARQAQALDELE